MSPFAEAIVATADIGGSQPSAPADTWRRRASSVGFVGVLAVLLAAPFETTTPWLRVPGQSISSLEIVVLLVCAGWVATVVRSGALPPIRTPLTTPGLLLLGSLTMASAVAPTDRANALHMVGRLACAAVLCAATVHSVTTASRAKRLLWIACASGTLAAVLVALDYSRVEVGQQLLSAFRTQTTSVGIAVRASGSFQYPTIASMFLELTFACAVGLLPVVWEARSGLARIGLLVSLLTMAAGVTLTYTRAGFICMATTLAIVGAQRIRVAGVDRVVVVLAGVAAVVAAMVPLSRPVEQMRLRFTSEGQEAWYRAEIQAPSRVELTTGGRLIVPVTVRNTGRVTWDSAARSPFRFSYHWLLSDSDRVVSWEGLRTSFPAPVAPGACVRLDVPLEAPRRPGTYRVVWDLEQERHLWFSTEPDAQLAISHATVRGLALSGAPPEGSYTDMPLPATRPGRPVLWAAALRMFAERPWLGVGPDNFRLRYGPYAGLARADPRVHTNNMYLELLVGGGVLCGLALTWFLWRSGRTIALALGVEGDRQGTALRAAAAAPVCAVAVHGLVDSFLGFTPTYVAIGISVGLLLACTSHQDSHAHRV